MEDCYSILGVHSSSSAAEIKRAFRSRAKALHPDITGEASGDERMLALIRAYETLSDPERRAEFDSMYARFRAVREGTDAVTGFDYRLWLMERTDAESRAKLIFFDLLHGLETEAVAEFAAQRALAGGFTLSRFFDREDFMDCGFILAEELAERADYYEAFLLLAEVVQLEREKPYFRHFFPEVIIFVRDLIRVRIPASLTDELALDCYELALELGLGKKDDAYVLRLMAASYERLGDGRMAWRCLSQALRMDPLMKGVREMKKRLEAFG